MSNVAKLPLTNKVKIAQTVLSDLHGTEAAIDAALLEANRLMATMIEARQELGLAATVGQGALARVVAGMGELSQARGEIAGAHAELNDLRLRMGMRTSMIGVLDKPQEGDPDGR